MMIMMILVMIMRRKKYQEMMINLSFLNWVQTILNIHINMNHDT